VKENKKDRVVRAPATGSWKRSGQILTVTLGEDEEVIWQWSHHPDGTSAVTGYEVVKKIEAKSKRSES
jgi:hypothetical protein